MVIIIIIIINVIVIISIYTFILYFQINLKIMKEKDFANAAKPDPSNQAIGFEHGRQMAGLSAMLYDRIRYVV